MLKAFHVDRAEFAEPTNLPESITHGRAEYEYRNHMTAVHDRIAQALPDVIFTVGNVSFGPDFPGMINISIQGEYVERVRQLMPEIMVSALTHEEFITISSRLYRESRYKDAA